jgi:hypothetical protein
MSDPHGAHGGQISTAPAFTDADWQEFQKADIKSGGAVVVLMTTIFLIGLVLYCGVLYFVMKSPAGA